MGRSAHAGRDEPGVRSVGSFMGRLAGTAAGLAALVSALALGTAPHPSFEHVVQTDEPGLAIASASLEWQNRATRSDAVPASVLRAAAAIRLAVIDTGADVAAPDIAAKRPLTYNTRTGNGDVLDMNGHGTFVTSLAAGGDVQLMVIKSGSQSGAFSDADEAAAIVYAVDHGANIVNLSVGGPTTSATE